MKRDEPWIFYQKMYAGHTWNVNNLIKKIKILYTYKKIGQSKYLLLATEEREDIMERMDLLSERFNFSGELIKPEELSEYYYKVSEEEAKKGANEFIRKSIGSIEPT